MKPSLGRVFAQYSLPFLAVMAGHVFLLWALVKGLAMAAPQPPEVVVMASIVSAPPIEQAEPEPQPEPPNPQPKPVVQPKVKKPQPLAVKPKQRTEPAPVNNVTAQEPPKEQPLSPAATSSKESSSDNKASSAPPSDTVVKPTKADYLNNPKPEYPALSRRMGEEGKVVLSVLINEQGRAEQVRIKRSSGFPRLDDAAQRAVKTWTYRAGTRNGQAEAMWFDVPVLFKLDEVF